MKQPDACTVRITDAQGKTLGTGFLVSTEGLIATCAHVVRGKEPCIAFPGGEPRPAHVVATDEAHDVAVLRVIGDLPPDAVPARLGHSADAYHQDFWSRGYRPMEGLEGIPAEGKVLDAVSEAPGYPGVRHMPLVLQTQHVRGGMSGAPIYVPDLDLVVGMITDSWDSLKAGTFPFDQNTALATPTEAIAALCPDVPLCEPRLAPAHRPFGVPFQAPPVPRYFVPRPEVTDDLKALLLTEETAAPGALVVSAVHGLGGIGKTTLVAALAHDPDVQARFPDGILWVTLGQQPEALSHLHEWIQVLRDYDFHPTTVDGASAHLRTLLHGRSCLLVADDAWQAESVRPFLVGGGHCRVLVTTRDATLARKVGAHLYDLDVMTEAQALALFEARLGPLDGNHEQAAALARELGHLPLALELAAAQVEGGSSWADLLEVFRRELADLRVLDLDEATYRNESLRLSFRLSLEQLSSDDQEAFAWLGVLPEDVRLNPAMAATLRNQPETESRKRLRRLRDKALLKGVGEEQYTVHDLLHIEAGLQLKEHMSLPEAHAALLVRYRAQTRDGLWHTLPDDGYIHERLAWHMEQAGQGEALHALLREETVEGRNAWYEARERLGQTVGYLADVARAWWLAEEAFAARSSPLAIGLQCRYALVTASLNSLAQNVPPALLVALVEKGMWTPLQGLAYARQSPELERRAKALAGLAPHLPEPLLQEALAAAREIEDERWRAKALVGLAPHLLEPLLREALAVAWRIDNERWQAEALAGLVPRLAELGSPREALAVTRRIKDDGRRAEALAGLAAQMPEPLLGEVLAVAREIGDEKWRAEALAGLAAYLREPLSHEALVAAREIEDKGERAKALARLVPRLSDLGHHQGALAAAREIGDEKWRAEALAGLAVHLPEDLREQALQEALATARGIEDEEWRAVALAGLAPYLPADLRGQVLWEALAATREIGNERRQIVALAKLAMHLPKPLLEEALVRLMAHLPEPLLEEALATAREIGEEQERAEALTGLIPRLAKFGYPWATLVVLPEIGDEGERAKALTELIPRLAELDYFQEMLALAYWIDSGESRAEAVTRLAAHLPEPLLGDVLAATRKIEDARWQAEVLTGLAAHLPAPLLREALAVVRKIGDEEPQAIALVRLVGHLPESLLGDALAAAREIADEVTRAMALAELAAHLAGPLLEEALAAAREIDGEEWRAEALAGMAAHLPEDLRERVLQEALATAREIMDEMTRAMALAGLAAHLPWPLLEEALAAAREIDEGWHVVALAGLVPRLAETGYPQEALAAAREIGWEQERAKALATLVPHLPEGLRSEVTQEALVAAQEIGNKKWRAETLAEMVPYLPEGLRGQVLQEALVAAREIEDKEGQAETLAGLVPRLAELGSPREALAVTQRIKHDGRRAEGLAGLAPYLPETLLREAMAAAWETQDEYSRAKALAALISHLPEVEQIEAMREVLATVWEIREERERGKVLVALASRMAAWAQQDKAALYALWRETLPVLATHTRGDLLSDLHALIPAIYALGGEEAIAETFRAIQDVGRWWP